MSQQLKYTVDIVLCIDATGSMKPHIDRVKENALRFHQDLNNNLSVKGKVIDNLRVKVIVFRDFYSDGDNAFYQSPFFALPSDNYDFSDFINSIQTFGGGDEPENALEALAVAIKSPWNKTGDKSRQVIVVWTDDEAHDLEIASKYNISNYPSDIPKNFNELTDLWEDGKHISSNGKRLIIFAPEKKPWKEILNFWELSLLYPSTAGKGLQEIEYNTIIDTIANSVG